MDKQDDMKNKSQGGFPDNQSKGQDTYSTTGDGHPPRPGEKRDNKTGERNTQDDMAGQGTGQMDRSGSSDQEAMTGSSTQDSIGGGMGSAGATTDGMGGSATGAGRMGAGTSSRTFEDAEKM